MDLGELAARAVSAIFGLLFVFGLLFALSIRNAHRWRSLAAVYGRPWHRPLKTRWLGNVVLYGGGPAFVTYNGIAVLGVHETGIALRLLPPFSMFHPPLFIPFSDIRAWKTFWFLNARSVELEFLRAQDIQMVLGSDDVRWISESANINIAVADVTAAHSARPHLWHALCLLGVVPAALLLAPIILFENPFGRSISDETLRAQFHLAPDIAIERANNRGRLLPCALVQSYEATAMFTPAQFARYAAGLDDPAVWAPAPLAHVGAAADTYRYESGALGWRDLPPPDRVGGDSLYWPSLTAPVTNGRYFCYALRAMRRDSGATIGSAAELIPTVTACSALAPAEPETPSFGIGTGEKPDGAIVRGVLDTDGKKLHMNADFKGWPEYCRLPVLRATVR